MLQWRSTSLCAHRVNGAEVEKTFGQEYEETNTPVMLTGLTENWPCASLWLLENLKTGPLRNMPMSCGEDEQRRPLRVKLKYFLSYMKRQRYASDPTHETHET